jgi:hypothetical protein
MQHELLFSKLRPLVEDPSFLETIRSSSSGENPHCAIAMEQIFEKAIQDCRERMATQEKNTSQGGHGVQPNSPPVKESQNTALQPQPQATNTTPAFSAPPPTSNTSIFSFRFQQQAPSQHEFSSGAPLDRKSQRG